MQTTRWCTVGVFSTTTSGCRGPIPSSAIAAAPSASSRALKAGSTQARATTRAPLERADVLLVPLISASTASVESRPFSTSSDSIARVRASAGESGSGWW